MRKFLLQICLFLLLPGITTGQNFYRIRADFSIKEKFANGISQLIIGSVYYDKTFNQVVYNIKFPQPEVWVLRDTVMYHLVNNKIVKRQQTFLAAKQSLFSLALSGEISDYGLKSSFFSIQKIKKEGSMVITTWVPDARREKVFGKILMSNVNKKLNTIVFYSPDNHLLSQQQFKNYVNISGLEFPCEVTQITYEKSGKNYQLTTYKNIMVDAQNEKDFYNFVIPR